MKKKKNYLITSICIVSTVMSLTSCTKNTIGTQSSSIESESKNNENTSQTDKDSKDSNKQNTGTSSKGNNHIGDTSSSDIEIKETQNKLNNEVSYPVFNNISNEDKVNKLILDYVEKINKLYTEDGEAINLSYQTMFKNNKYISIYFSGEIKNSGSPYVPKFKSTLNINVEKASVMHLSDICNLNDKFINSCSNGIEEEFKKFNSEVTSTYKKENLKSLLEQSDVSMQYISDVQSYFTDTKVVVIFSVPHAIGDYMIINIPNASIDNYIDLN